MLNPFPVQVSAFVDDQVNVALAPPTSGDGLELKLQLIGAGVGAVTVNVVQGLQLFPSSDSATLPVHEVFKSAQPRYWYVPGVEIVREAVKVAVAPGAAEAEDAAKSVPSPSSNILLNPFAAAVPRLVAPAVKVMGPALTELPHAGV